MKEEKKKCLQYLCYSRTKGIGGNLLDYGDACTRRGINGKGG